MSIIKRGTKKVKATLDKVAIKIANIACSCKVRSTLQQVKIEKGEILAADGFICIKKSIETEDLETSVMLIEAADILKAKKLAGRQLETLTISSDGKISMVENVKSSTKVMGNVSQVEYPDMKQFYPTENRKAYIAIDSCYLAKLLDVVGRHTTIKFRIREESTAIEFVVEEYDVSGLIMPIWTKEESKHWNGG